MDFSNRSTWSKALQCQVQHKHCSKTMSSGLCAPTPHAASHTPVVGVCRALADLGNPSMRMTGDIAFSIACMSRRTYKCMVKHYLSQELLQVTAMHG
jgi:hypothetical protein